MTYNDLTSALRYTSGPKLGMMLATFWVVFWRAWQMTLSAPLRLARYLRANKRYTWLEYFLTIILVGLVLGLGYGLDDFFLRGNGIVLWTTVLIWIVPCMIGYGLACWWNIDDFEEDD